MGEWMLMWFFLTCCLISDVTLIDVSNIYAPYTLHPAEKAGPQLNAHIYGALNQNKTGYASETARIKPLV